MIIDEAATFVCMCVCEYMHVLAVEKLLFSQASKDSNPLIQRYYYNYYRIYKI